MFVPLMFLLTLAAVMQSLSVQGAVEQVHGYLSASIAHTNQVHSQMCAVGGGDFGDALEPTSLFRLREHIPAQMSVQNWWNKGL